MRKQDFLMKLHIPLDRKKKRLNRSCSVLEKDPRAEEEEAWVSRKWLDAFRVSKTFSEDVFSISHHFMFILY